MPREASKGIQFPPRLRRSRPRKADGTALRPMREAAEKVPLGSERAKNLRANKKSACRFADAAEAGGPARIRCSRSLRQPQLCEDRSFEELLDSFLDGETSSLRGGNNKDGVVAGDGARNFRKMFCVNGRSQRLSAAWRGFQHEHVSRRANIRKKFT